MRFKSAVGALCIIILKTISQMAPNFFSWIGIDIRYFKSSQDDIAMKDSAVQIACNWIKMINLLTSIHEDQKAFVSRLQTELESKNDTFCQNIIKRVEEEFLKSNQRFSKIEDTIQTMQESILFMKDILKKLLKLANVDESKKPQKMEAADSWAQTDEYETKKKSKETRSKNRTYEENESPRLVTLTKKCLKSALKDVKLQLSIDREEENSEFQIICAKLQQDHEDIMKTIVHAFSAAREEEQRKFASFGQIGQDVMHYIAMQNESSNKILKIKVEETEGILKEILKTLNCQTLDVVSVREALDNIDDTLQEVGIRCQRNTEHCDNMAHTLEKAAKKWMRMVSSLAETAENFTDNTKSMKDMLTDMKNTIDLVLQKNIQGKQIVPCANNEIIQGTSASTIRTLDLDALSSTNRNLMFMHSMIEACSEKLTNFNNTIGNGYDEICQAILTLTHKLRSLNQSAEKLDQVFRENEKKIISKITSANYHDVSSEKNEGVDVESNMKDAGDCQPHISKSVRTIYTDKTLAENVQNAVSLDCEFKMVERILRKVHDKVRNNSCFNAQTSQKMQDNFSSTMSQTKEEQGKTTDTPVSQMVTKDGA